MSAPGAPAVVLRRPAPPDARARRTAGWVVAMLVMEILLQRLAIPGQPAALLWPLTILWTGAALVAGVVQVDPRRAIVWCVAEAATGLAMLVQIEVLPAPVISINSWLLFTLVWLPAVTRFVDRRLDTYLLALRWSVNVLTGLAGVCVVMMASQFAGLAYQDWVAKVVPGRFLLEGYAISYPLTFGSPIYKSNAWVGLEPSFISFLLGIGVLAAVVTRRPWRVLLLLFAGLATTASGSGFLILLAGIPALLISPGRRAVMRYAIPAAVGAVALILTPLGQDLLGRAGEAGDSGSSASLRGVLPYQVLWPAWSHDPLGILAGNGPGSSQRVLEGSGISGLLTPTPAKIFFDYGLVAGMVLVAFLLFCYLEGPSLSLAFSLFVSLWLIQPGNQPVTVVPVLLLVTLWAPRIDRRVEDVLDPARAGQLSFRRPGLIR